MRLDKKQKIAVIFSVVFFIVWIVTLALLTKKDYKGSLTNATFTATVGCAAAIIFYVLILADKAQVNAKLSEKDTLKIKSCVISAYIAVLYVVIAGFFMMSVASLFTAYDIKEVRKFNWVGATVLITMLMLTVCVLTSYFKVRGVERRLSLQEHNDNLDDESKSEVKAERV